MIDIVQATEDRAAGQRIWHATDDAPTGMVITALDWRLIPVERAPG